MTSLISAHSLTKAYGTQHLFEGLSFTINLGDKVGLIGPNGAGKSTLIKILGDLETPDEGYVSRRQGLKIGYASQSPEFDAMPLEDLLARELPKGDEIEVITRARILLGKAQFSDYTQDASLLSGGWKKRLDICRALMIEPDLLLLDEPTNHLDLEGILWLERFLQREKISYLVISHDRYFLENVTNKIVEINRCYPQGLFISSGNMSDFMEHRDAFLEAQRQREKGLAAVVRGEIEWLRKSPQARTTKSKSRIDKAYELMDTLSEVKARNKTTKVDIDFSASERETRKLLVTKNLTKSLGGKPLFSGVDITLSPGTRLGIVGKNGTGKTTLLKVLAGSIPQDQGTIKLAEDLKLVYFDQHREHIPPNVTLKEALAPTNDVVIYRGQSIHVNGWAKKFLFSPDRMELPVGCLSGGERARILIAKLMLEPADILFLDEPTNDLDISTLEVIEESLKEFAGAVVLISHDRCLMDRVCTQILGLGTPGEQGFFADYNQWERAKAAALEAAPKKEVKPVVAAAQQVPKPKKLSYNEQRELDGMEKAIEKVEEEISSLQLQLEDPVVQSDAKKSLDLYNEMAKKSEHLEKLFARWQELSK